MKISLVAINTYYICIQKNEVKLSQILYMGVYVQITLIKQLIRKKLARASKRIVL